MEVGSDARGQGELGLSSLSSCDPCRYASTTGELFGANAVLGAGQTVLQWSPQSALHGACRFNRPWIEIALLRRQRAGSPAFEAQHWRLPFLACVLVGVLIDLGRDVDGEPHALFSSVHSRSIPRTEMASLILSPPPWGRFLSSFPSLGDLSRSNLGLLWLWNS